MFWRVTGDTKSCCRARIGLDVGVGIGVAIGIGNRDQPTALGAERLPVDPDTNPDSDTDPGTDASFLFALIRTAAYPATVPAGRVSQEDNAACSMARV